MAVSCCMSQGRLLGAKSAHGQTPRRHFNYCHEMQTNGLLALALHAKRHCPDLQKTFHLIFQTNQSLTILKKQIRLELFQSNDMTT
jgi:hypothetical protein